MYVKYIAKENGGKIKRCHFKTKSSILSFLPCCFGVCVCVCLSVCLSVCVFQILWWLKFTVTPKSFKEYYHTIKGGNYVKIILPLFGKCVYLKGKNFLPQGTYKNVLYFNFEKVHLSINNMDLNMIKCTFSHVRPTKTKSACASL